MKKKEKQKKMNFKEFQIDYKKNKSKQPMASLIFWLYWKIYKIENPDERRQQSHCI